MAYRLAHSLEQLRSQVNLIAPNRNKKSDGWVGDSVHFAQGSASDHNPWVRQGDLGIVTAIDITHDPANGCDVMAIANSIIASRDRRMKYMIYTGGSGGRPGIISATVAPWTWRVRSYDDHSHHLHISVNSNVSDYDSPNAWALEAKAPDQPEPVVPPVRGPFPLPLGRGYTVGSRGYGVKEIQKLLQMTAVPTISVDGIFGSVTANWVGIWTKRNGPYTTQVVNKQVWDFMARWKTQ